MVRRYGVVPKGRGLIAGNGPLGLQLVHEMIKLGKNQIILTERAKFNSGSDMLIPEQGESYIGQIVLLSNPEDCIDIAKSILRISKTNNCKIILPLDLVVSKKFEKNAKFVVNLDV